MLPGIKNLNKYVLKIVVTNQYIEENFEKLAKVAADSSQLAVFCYGKRREMSQKKLHY
jgi:hypothetical protein